MGTSSYCDKLVLKKGPWTPEEDHKLLAYIEEHGHGNWRALPSKAGLQRCGKSCRLRWTNYLRPDIKRGKFSLQEEQTIIQLHALLGNRWSAIATHLPKRTDNEIKNYWNTHLKKRLTKMGIDPVTHKPKNEGLLSTRHGGQQTKNAATLSHMAQWESARLEAEARLVRQSKPRPMINNFDITTNITYNTSSDSSSNGTSIMPQCLDVLEVWNNSNLWQPSSSNSATTTTTPAIGLGLAGGGGSGGLDHDSPTSTHSFSENDHLLQVPIVGPAVIEFMEHGRGTENDKRNNNSQLEQVLVKEEESMINSHNGGHNQYHYHNRHDIRPNMPTMEHCLSFSASSVLNGIMKSSDDDEANDDNVHDHDHHHQSFMEGFTELLLGGATVKNNGKSQIKESGAQGGGNNNGNNSINEDNDGRGCTSSSWSGYYEDNKNYWNTILNLVNSSPSHSPMF